MSADIAINSAAERATANAGRDFARRFTNMLCELRLQIGIQNRIERIMNDFAEEHPNVRGAYLSRNVDASYFSDGAYGWEADSKPKLQGIAIEGENLFEFIAFTNGIRIHTTPLTSIMNVEELWLETAPDAPFTFRVCMFHSFPATTILVAPDGDSQDAAVAFVQRIKYLRGL
ncbi:MAG TPA: hypothetical protein VKT77_04820 [Chthonomonadaceae bacterium]|nr:hypothetical protein [Chthonomonadaceae bacterium]